MMRANRILQIASLSLLLFVTSSASIRAQFNPYAQAMQQNMYLQQLMRSQMYGANTLPGFNNPYYGGGFTPFNPRAFTPAMPFAAPGVDPYSGGLANPYSPTAPGFGVGNPYLPNPVDPYNPYNPYNPYAGGYGGAYGAGQYLMGSADVMRSYGQVINAQESARILREQANQAKLDTRKKAFELELYIKANTPTYTQQQEKVARDTLRRIQSNSLPGEVVNGTSLNYLLDDLRKFPSKKISLEPINLSEAVLTHLNVTSTKYGMGLLRDDGIVTFPVALQERMSVKQRKDLEEQLKDLVKGAYKGNIDGNVLKDVRAEMEKLREDLVKRTNETPTGQYMEAKRFLQELDEATLAVEAKEAQNQAKFQRFIEGGRSIQDVVDFMVKNGYRFGRATARDEAAYRATHSALATFDIAMNSALGIETKDQ